MTDQPKPVKRYALINDTGTWMVSMREMCGGAWIERADYETAEQRIAELERETCDQQADAEAYTDLIDKQAATIERLRGNVEELKDGQDHQFEQALRAKKKTEEIKAEVERLHARTDIDHDSAYANGMKAGWNFRDSENYEGFHRAHEALRHEISAACAALKENK